MGSQIVVVLHADDHTERRGDIASFAKKTDTARPLGGVVFGIVERAGEQPQHRRAENFRHLRPLPDGKQLHLADGSEWAFDVPKIYLSTAEGIAVSLTA